MRRGLVGDHRDAHHLRATWSFHITSRKGEGAFLDHIRQDNAYVPMKQGNIIWDIRIPTSNYPASNTYLPQTSDTKCIQLKHSCDAPPRAIDVDGQRQLANGPPIVGKIEEVTDQFFLL